MNTTPTKQKSGAVETTPPIINMIKQVLYRLCYCRRDTKPQLSEKSRAVETTPPTTHMIKQVTLAAAVFLCTGPETGSATTFPETTPSWIYIKT